MRIAVLGAAASALLGGTLAVTPLTSVSTPLPAAGHMRQWRGSLRESGVGPHAQDADTVGAGCAGGAGAGGSRTRRAGGRGARAGCTGGQRDSARVATGPGTPSAASAVPGVASPGVSAGGVPDLGVPGVGLPGTPDLGALGVGGLPDPWAVASSVPGLLPAIGGIATAAAVPSSIGAAMSLLQGVVGVGGSVVGVGDRRRGHADQRRRNDCFTPTRRSPAEEPQPGSSLDPWA